MRQTDLQFQSHLADAFRVLCVAYADFVQQEGVSVVAFTDPTLPLFRALPLTAQTTLIRSMQSDIEIFQSIRSESLSLRDSSHHLWRHMSSIKAIPDSDLFDKIGPTDLVEMYTVDQSRYSQIFRNLRVLECTSFTLEQLFGMDWRFALKRTPEDQRRLADCGHGVLTGKFPKTFSPDLPAQIIREVGSLKEYTFKYLVKHLSPVRVDGKVFGVISVSDCETIGSWQ